MNKAAGTVLTFAKEKETKNAIRYQEETENGQPPKIGALYVQKWAFPTSPEKITVTIDE